MKVDNYRHVDKFSTIIPKPPPLLNRWLAAKSRAFATDLILLAILWAAIIIVINPSGEFPIDDDVQFSFVVQRLVENNLYEPGRNLSMTLITHALWGTLFAELFGYSYETLRASTLVMSFLGLAGIYYLTGMLSSSRAIQWLATLAVAFNPLYLYLSFTFMTDITFCVLTVYTFIFFIRCLRQESNIDLGVACFFSVALMLCRQLGLFFSTAFFLTYLFHYGVNRKSIARGSLPVIANLLVYLWFNYWIKSIKGQQYYGQREFDILSKLANNEVSFSDLVNNVFAAAMTFGFLLLPVLVMVNIFKGVSLRRGRLILLGLAGLWIVAVQLTGQLMPIKSDYIDPGLLNTVGVGQLLLYDTFVLGLPHVSPLPMSLLVFATILASLGAFYWVVFLVMRLKPFATAYFSVRRDNENTATLLFTLCIAIYFSPFFISGFPDRYLLPIIIAAIFLLVSSVPKEFLSKTRYWISMGVIAGVFIPFSVGAVHDYLSLNRARWLAVDKLVNEWKIPLMEIDGGAEIFAFKADPVSTMYTDISDLCPHQKPNDIWHCGNETYVVAFGVIPGFEPIFRYNYTRWLSKNVGQIVVLRRHNTDNQSAVEPRS